MSAPCSTGEEVYSIAIYLLEEGNYIKKRDFILVGIDIDSLAIEKAKEGLYSERSLHKVPQNLREKYFIKEGEFYRVRPFLRESVSFEVVNVLDKYRMKRLGMFDVIFSRNMLIYFEERERLEAIANFYSIMKPGGYLFLGHAERIPSHFKLFKPVKLGKSFLYVKEED
ncbi:MAG: CheR family methyltransferase [Persephonella sp.]|nr:CheR family methyltransferase [Persephonella sp.]